MVDFDLAQIHPFFFENGDLPPSHMTRRVGVHHDRYAGLQVGACHCPGHGLQRRRYAFEIRRALEHAGLDVGAAKAVGEILDEFIGHLIGAHTLHEAGYV